MPARPFKDVLLGPEQSGQAYPLTPGRGLNTWVREGQPLQPASITEKRGCFPGVRPPIRTCAFRGGCRSHRAAPPGTRVHPAVSSRHVCFDRGGRSGVLIRHGT